MVRNLAMVTVVYANARLAAEPTLTWGSSTVAKTNARNRPNRHPSTNHQQTIVIRNSVLETIVNDEAYVFDNPQHL